MSYTLADVDAAEKRIRAECPGIELHRFNYGWTLEAKKTGALWSVTVFDTREGGPTIMPHGDHDLDWVIRTMNGAPVRRKQ
jgi:hypothetical protein